MGGGGGAVHDHPNFTWAASLVHLAADGTVQQQVSGFIFPTLASRCGPDGSIWVVDTSASGGWAQLRRISSDGRTLATVTNVDGNTGDFITLEVNPTDGTCWAMFEWGYQSYRYGLLVHVGTAGDVLGNFSVGSDAVWGGRRSLAPEGLDGSVWWWDPGNRNLVHTSSAGTELLRIPSPNDSQGNLAVDPSDGSCWASGWSRLVQVGSDGATLSSLACPYSLPDFVTGTYWGADWESASIRRGQWH